MRRVKIVSGWSLFVGQTGEAVKECRMNGTTVYRVYLDQPVMVDGVGLVKDDLWEGRHLKTVK